MAQSDNAFARKLYADTSANYIAAVQKDGDPGSRLKPQAEKGVHTVKNAFFVLRLDEVKPYRLEHSVSDLGQSLKEVAVGMTNSAHGSNTEFVIATKNDRHASTTTARLSPPSFRCYRPPSHQQVRDSGQTQPRGSQSSVATSSVTKKTGSPDEKHRKRVPQGARRADASSNRLDKSNVNTTQPLKLKICLDERNPRPAKLALVFGQHYTQHGEPHFVESTFEYAHDNIRDIKIRKLPSVTSLPACVMSSLNTEAVEDLSRNIANGCLEVQVYGKGWSDVDVFHGLRTHLRDQDYRPEHLHAITSIRAHVESDHMAYFLIFDLQSMTAFEDFHAEVKQQRHKYSLKASLFPLLRLKQPLDANSLSPHPPCAIFQTGYDFLATEAFAEHFEHQYAKETRKLSTTVEARFIEIPGGEGTTLIALVDPRSVKLAYPASDGERQRKIEEQGALLAQLKENDTLTVRLCDIVLDDVWSGEVIQLPPYADPDHIAIKIVSRHDYTGERAVVRLGSIKKSVVSMSNMSDPESTAALLKGTRPCDIALTRHVDTKTEKRIAEHADIIDKRFMQERNDNNGRPGQHEILLCGTRLDLLPLIDAFKDLPVAYLETLRDLLRDRPDCAAVIDHMSALPAGLMLLSGLTGTGKTFLVYAIVKTLWQAQCDGVEGIKLKLLAAGHSHDSTDDLFRLFQSIGNGIKVLRLHSTETERSIAFQDVHLIKSTPVNMLKFDKFQAELEDLFCARALCRQLRQQVRDDVPGLRDKRVTYYMESLGYKILYECGLVDNAKHPTDQLFWKFNAYFRMVEADITDIKPRRNTLGEDTLQDSESEDGSTNGSTDGSSLANIANFNASAASMCGALYTCRNGPNPEHVGILAELYGPVAKAVIAKHDIVVTTVAQAGNSMVRSAFQPSLLVVDNADRAPSLQVGAFLLAYPQASVRILVGDPLQCQNKALAPISANPFGSQLSIPLFIRMLVDGFPHVQLTHTEVLDGYQVQMLASLLKSPMQTSVVKTKSLASDVILRADRKRLLTMLGGTDFAMRNHIALNVGKTQESVVGANRSKRNERSAANVWDVLRRVAELGTTSFPPKDILILSEYQDQVKHHKRILAHMIALVESGQFKFGTWSSQELAQIMISTVRRFNGEQCSLTLWDVTSTDKIGNVRNPATFTVAISRARDITVVVYDHKNLDEAGAFRKGLLARWMKLVDEWKLRVDYKPGEPLDKSEFIKIGRTNEPAQK